MALPFYDHATPGWTAARAYLVTTRQLADIAAQEMYRLPVDGDPLEEILLSPLPEGRHTFGDGRYETLVEVGTYDDLPLLTFTSPHTGPTSTAAHSARAGVPRDDGRRPARVPRVGRRPDRGVRPTTVTGARQR